MTTGDVSLSSEKTQYLSGSIKWSGLSSGVDFSSVVDQLVEIEKTQVNRLETWKGTWEDKITSIRGLNTRMAALKSFTKEFDSYSEFYSRSAVSSNTTVLDVTSTSSASPGSHIVQVGENIPGRVASLSYDSTAAVGGPAGATLTINVGASTVTLVEGVDYLATDTIDQLAAKINAVDDNGSDILEDVTTVVDKDRSGTTYKRLIITAKTGGSANAVTVSDPTNLSLDANAVDAVYEKTWVGSSHATSGGSYTGSTNKTFTFRVATTGTVGVDDITIQWADNKGNSGSFVVSAAATDYDVFQGVTLQLSAGTVYQDDSFTIDAYTPTLQAAQDKGLAQVEQRVHTGFIDLLSPVTTVAADLVYRYEGVETTVHVDADATLRDLANAINSDENNRGVVATIINDGQSTSTSYHLVLTGRDTGADHSIVIVSSGLDQINLSDGQFSTAQKASNAMIKVDGYPTSSSEYIQRPSNNVSDVLSNLTLQLRGVGSSTVTVSNDTETIRDNIEMFVNAVNYILDYIREETKYDSATKESGVMIGNYTYDIVRSEISRIMSESIPGLSREDDPYVHLAQIGIRSDPDQNGKWVIDNSTLDQALNDDLESVARLFVKDEENSSTGVADRLQALMEAYTDSETGIGNVLIDNYQGIIKDIDSRIDREERRIEMVRQRLEEQFARLETLLGQLDGQSQTLENQLEQLPSIGNRS